jgi:two-component system, response regulator PdtaR
MNSAAPIGDPASSRRTILVVEDEILARMLLTDELRRHGFDVAEAKSTDEALSIVHAGIAVHVALINLETSGSRNAVRLAATLRAEYPSMKVLIASGQTSRTEFGETVDGYLRKPYDVPQLVAAIQSLLD